MISLIIAFGLERAPACSVSFLRAKLGGRKATDKFRKLGGTLAF